MTLMLLSILHIGGSPFLHITWWRNWRSPRVIEMKYIFFTFFISWGCFFPQGKVVTTTTRGISIVVSMKCEPPLLRVAPLSEVPSPFLQLVSYLIFFLTPQEISLYSPLTNLFLPPFPLYGQVGHPSHTHIKSCQIVLHPIQVLISPLWFSLLPHISLHC